MSRFPKIEPHGARRGVAAVEFALAVPILLLALLAGTDLSVFLRTKMHLDQVTEEVAITVTQHQDLYDSDFTTFFDAAQAMAGTMPVTGLFGTTIITGIVNNGSQQTIAWQRRSPSATFTSLFGTAPGGAVNLPNHYVLPSGRTLIAVELFTSASPWVFSVNLMGHSDVSSLRSYALFQPRLGSLATITAGNRP